MSLWGNLDLKPQTNTATATLTVTAANATVVGVNTLFSTDFQVGDFLYVGNNNYVFEAIANATVATVRAGEAGAALVSNASSNGAYVVSEKPKYVVYSHSQDSVNSEAANNIYGVSAAEISFANTASEANAITHTGWNKRTVGSGGRAGRVFYETLVAGGISGDAGDDTILPE